MATFNFSESDGTLLSAIDAKWLGGSVFQTSGGVLQSNSQWTENVARYSDSQGDTQYIEAVFKAGTSAGGQTRKLFTRHVDASNNYELRLTAAVIALYRNTTFINNYTHGIDTTTTDVTLRLEQVPGSGGSVDLTARLNGVSRITYNDTSPRASGIPAFQLYPAGTNSSVRIDNVDVQSAPAVPAAPSGVTGGSVTFKSASVSWTDNSGDETGFKVRYAPSPYSSWTTAIGSVAASPYVIDGLSENTSYKAGVAAFNANGDSTWAESGVFTTTALAKLRPSADTTTGSWSASSGAVLYTMIDEANADDTDYITTSVNATCKIKLETGTDPVSGANHVLRVRARGTGGTLRAELVQSATPETTIASWAITYTASFADFDLSLTSAQADAITDYSALYVKLISS